MGDYDLGIIRADDVEILCGGYKVSVKQSTDKIDITSSYDSVGWKNGKNEYSIDCSDVYPEIFPQVLELWKNKTKFTLSLYNILEDGTYQECMVLLGCQITEFDYEMKDGQTSSFKAEALSLQP